MADQSQHWTGAPRYVLDACRFPFRVGTPWALIERNSGHQLAYLVEAKADPVNPNGPLLYKGHIWSDTSQSYSKTARPIGHERIRRFWRNPPNWDAVKRAKTAANRKLRLEEKRRHFGRALRSAA